MTDHQLESDVGEWLIRVRTGDVPVSVLQARIQSKEVNQLALAELDPKLTPASEIDGSIEAPHGAMTIRVLRPAGKTPKPTIVYFHGGGWVLGDLDTHLGHARRICVQVDAVVVSVAYRLAPENRFPAAFDDALLATQWAAEHLDELGGNSTLVVAGDTAGGQLAASVALARRDAGQPLAAQLLLYPVTDVLGRYADETVNAYYMSRGTSHQRFGLTLDGMTAFAHHYVDEENSGDWRVSPMRAADFSGVAPAVIHTSTLDVLRTEGNFYADKLREAGVPVIAREFPSLNHSYFGLGGISAVADAAAAQAAEDLHEVLAGRG
jgi:acetyl esterase